MQPPDLARNGDAELDRGAHAHQCRDEPQPPVFDAIAEILSRFGMASGACSCGAAQRTCRAQGRAVKALPRAYAGEAARHRRGATALASSGAAVRARRPRRAIAPSPERAHDRASSCNPTPRRAWTGRKSISRERLRRSTRAVRVVHVARRGLRGRLRRRFAGRRCRCPAARASATHSASAAASRRPRLRPCAPIGGITWAASPTSATRSRGHARGAAGPRAESSARGPMLAIAPSKPCRRCSSTP